MPYNKEEITQDPPLINNLVSQLFKLWKELQTYLHTRQVIYSTADKYSLFWGRDKSLKKAYNLVGDTIC